MTTETPPDAHHLPTSRTPDPSDAEMLSPLEQEVLDEYARLRDNLDNMANLLADLTVNPAPEILDALRGLERKTSLVFTLLKASVYSIVLNQQIRDQDEDEMDLDSGDGGSDGAGLGNSRGDV